MVYMVSSEYFINHLVHEAELGQFHRDTVNEATGAGAEKRSSHQGGGASRHVNDTGAREIENTAVQEEIGLPVFVYIYVYMCVCITVLNVYA